MEKQKLLQASYLDILYDERNKSYGGYELRSKYPKRVRRALSAVLLCTGIASAVPVIAGMMGKPEDLNRKLERVVDLANLETPPVEPTPPMPKVETPPSEVAAAKITPPVIVENDQVAPDDLMADKDDLKDKMISDHNQDGDKTDTDISLPDDLTGKGPGGPAVVETPAPPSGPLVHVEQMPEFNGDVNSYLSSKLRYPEQAREAGIEGRVVVKFVVNEDGDITGAQVIRSIGGGCDEEALRVVNAMPRWKAGRQNGRAVKVYFNLAIKFDLE